MSRPFVSFNLVDEDLLYVYFEYPSLSYSGPVLALHPLALRGLLQASEHLASVSARIEGGPTDGYDYATLTLAEGDLTVEFHTPAGPESHTADAPLLSWVPMPEEV